VDVLLSVVQYIYSALLLMYLVRLVGGATMLLRGALNVDNESLLKLFSMANIYGPFEQYLQLRKTVKLNGKGLFKSKFLGLTPQVIIIFHHTQKFLGKNFCGFFLLVDSCEMANRLFTVA
jgi:hypothetical protein